jgi:hypothetical protein
MADMKYGDSLLKLDTYTAPVSVFILVATMILFIWIMASAIKRAAPRHFEGLHSADHNATPFKLAPHIIAAVGIMLLMIGGFGCVVSLVMTAQYLNFQEGLFWAFFSLCLLMSGMLLYGRHLYKIRESVIKLYLGRSGFYYADLNIATTRRPFWALLDNKNFIFQSYSAVEEVEVVNHPTGSRIRILTKTESFILPIIVDDEQEIARLASVIKVKACI